MHFFLIARFFPFSTLCSSSIGSGETLRHMRYRFHEPEKLGLSSNGGAIVRPRYKYKQVWRKIILGKNGKNEEEKEKAESEKCKLTEVTNSKSCRQSLRHSEQTIRANNAGAAASNYSKIKMFKSYPKVEICYDNAMLVQSYLTTRQMSYASVVSLVFYLLFQLPVYFRYRAWLKKKAEFKN